MRSRTSRSRSALASSMGQGNRSLGRSSIWGSPEALTAVGPRIGLNTILVPVDFSAACTKAVHYGVTLAERFGSRLILLHVVEEGSPISGIESIPESLLDHHVGRKLESKLSAIALKVAPATLPVTPLVVQGKPHRKIVQEAASLNADLIIMGTKGNTGLKRVLMGSVAEQVVREAQCPVLVVRERERDFVTQPKSER